MYFLKKYYDTNIKHDLINKFVYKKSEKVPEISKISLNFNCRTTDIKNLSANLLALELITKQKGILTKSKSPNILLKIRKGQPVGCKISLRKKKAFAFIDKLTKEVLPKLKNLNSFRLKKKEKFKNSFSFKIHETFSFRELENNYQMFNGLKSLDIIITIKNIENKETSFILHSLKLPFILN